MFLLLSFMNLVLCVLAVIFATNVIGINQPTTTISTVPKCFDQVSGFSKFDEKQKRNARKRQNKQQVKIRIISKVKLVRI